MIPATLLNVPFRSGIDEKTDPRQAAPGTLTSLVNGVWTRAGEVRKRFGLAALSPVDTAGGSVLGKKLFVRGDELCLLSTTDRVYSYVEGLDRWRDAGPVSPWSATWSTVLDASDGVVDPCCIVLGTEILVAWRSGDLATGYGYIYAAVLDLATLAVLVAPSRRIATATGAKPVLVLEGSLGILAYYNGTALIVERFSFATRAWTTWAGVAVSGLYGTTTFAYAPGGSYLEPPGLDMIAGASGEVIVCYADTLSPTITLLKISTATLLTTGIAQIASYVPLDPVTDISIAGASGGTVHVAWATYSGAAIGTYLGAWDFAGGVEPYAPVLIAASPQRVGVALEPASGRVVTVFGGFFVGTGAIGGSVYVSSPTTGVSFSTTVVDGVPVTRPWVTGGKVFCAFQSRFIDPATTFADVLYPASIFVAEVCSALSANEATIAVASVAPRQAGERSMHVCSVAVSGTQTILLTPQSVDQSVKSGHQAAQLTRLDTASDAPFACAQFGAGGALLSSSIPYSYDGVAPRDVGFGGYALTSTSNFTFSNTARGSLPNGTYLYAVGWEFRDARGLAHRSPTYGYAPIPATLAGANDTITLVGVPSLVMTSKQRSLFSTGVYQPYVVVYRTDAGGTVYYRVTQEPGQVTAPVQPGVLAVANILDYDNLTAVINRVPMYTSGGVLDDQHPPGFLHVCAHKNRLWGISGDRRTLWFSKSTQDDPRVFPGFNDALTLRVDDAGDLVALASLDTILIVLTDAAAFYVDGDGPGPTGLSSDLTVRRIPTGSIGCATPRSVVVSPAGVHFLGTDGELYTITRQLELQPFGTSVQDTIAAFPTCTSAVLVDADGQVRFTFVDALAAHGVTLVFDYRAGAWSRFEHTDQLATVTQCPARDAALWRGAWVILTGSGRVYRENRATSLDFDTWVTLTIETAWISSGGLASWQRVRRVQPRAEYVSPHGLVLSIAVDDSASYTQTATFTTTHIDQSRDAVTVHVGSQNGTSPRCKSIRLKINDVANTSGTTGTGAGARFSGVSLEIVPMPDVSRHGARGAKF